MAETEINFWVMPNAGFSTRPILAEAIEEFEQLNPDVKIRLTVHPWSLSWARSMDVIKGRFEGPRPDVLQVGTTWVPTLVYLGALDEVPSTRVLPDDDDSSAYIWDPGHQSEVGHDFYCVPWFIDVRVLYYRRDIFEQAGLQRESLQDWQGLLHACAEIEKFIQKGNTKILAPLGFPGQKPSVLMHDLAPWVWAAGGDFCSPDLKEGTLLQPAFVKACEYYFGLINQGHMPMQEGHLLTGNFFTGHYAMQFSGSWPLDTYLNPDSPLSDKAVATNAEVAMFPSGPQGRYTFLGGSNLSVASTSQNKELAWQFVKFITHPERQKSHARAIGALPARLASMDDLFKNRPSSRKVFLDSFGHARRLPRLIELGSVEQIIDDMSERILSLIRRKEYTSKRLKEEIASANAQVNAVLSIHGYGAKPLMRVV
jgi:multiple sugar transport system substrate-binding protein